MPLAKYGHRLSFSAKDSAFGMKEQNRAVTERESYTRLIFIMSGPQNTTLASVAPKQTLAYVVTLNWTLRDCGWDFCLRSVYIHLEGPAGFHLDKRNPGNVTSDFYSKVVTSF